MRYLFFALIFTFPALADSYSHECIVLMQAESYCELGKKNTGKEENLQSFVAPGFEKKFSYKTNAKNEVDFEDDDNSVEEKKRIAKKTGSDSQVTKNLLVACGPQACREDLAQEFQFKMQKPMAAINDYLKRDKIWGNDTSEKFISHFPIHMAKALNDLSVNVVSEKGAKALLNELERAKSTQKLFGKSLTKDQITKMHKSVAAMLEEKGKSQWKLTDELMKEVVKQQRGSVCQMGWTHWNQASSYSDYEPSVEIIPTSAERVDLVVALDGKENKCGLTPESKQALEAHQLNLSADAICAQVRAKCKSPKKPNGTVKAGFDITKEIDIHKALEDAPLKGGETVLLAETGKQLKLYNSTCEVLGIGNPVYVLESSMNEKAYKNFHAEHSKGRIVPKGQEMNVTCE